MNLFKLALIKPTPECFTFDYINNPLLISLIIETLFEKNKQ